MFKKLMLGLSIAACVMANAVYAEDAALKKAISSSNRAPENVARDAYRHPQATLEFFGVRPEMTVVEVWPGGGWYSEILAPYLHDKGHYYAAHFDASSPSTYFQKTLTAFKAKTSARPDMFGAMQMTEFSLPAKLELAPKGSADRVFTFRNVHNWYMAGGDASVQMAFKAFYDTLKPGGVLGVVDHRLPASRPAADMAQSGYMHEAYVIKMAESVGFKLVAKSEINANPADNAMHDDGVWSLPPTYASGDKNRAQYTAIGESDRMTLKFMK